MMPQEIAFIRSRLKTPRAAAVAGILFSILLIAIFWLFRYSVPADPLEPGTWLEGEFAALRLALNLIPFAGITFLWFIGVLRDRLGEMEDRFFATVFLGSALLFLAILFVAASIFGALFFVSASTELPEALKTANFRLGRAAAYILVNVYAAKMATVFMISTSTLVIYTGIAPRWMAMLGYAFALLLLVGSYYVTWILMTLPVWTLLISVHILSDNLRADVTGHTPLRGGFRRLPQAAS
jgi:hypothetical protein